MRKEYCENCQKLVNYKTNKRNIKEIINGVEIEYEEIYNTCEECGMEFYTSEAHDMNIYSYGEKIRKVNNIITISEIKDILNKYDIGKKPLALVLGWGETTIIRYLDGQIPEKIYSDILKKISDNPEEMQKYVEKNRSLISDVAYRKVMSKIAEIQLIEDSSYIYLISKHIIARTNDITPLALQKILYYIQGFSASLLGKMLFNDKCEAWVHGPVYKQIYNRFCCFHANPIDKDDLVDQQRKFSDYNQITVSDKKDIELIDAVIKYFGCYSGTILENMTHASTPWQQCRKGLTSEQPSNREIDQTKMKNYFDFITKKYKMKTASDIAKYSCDLFKEVSKDFFK